MLSEKTIRKPKTKSPDEALASLMRLCARAEKSSGDALRLMRTWGVPEADRNGVLQKITSQRFIDDERYASAFVREKTRLNGWGALKIRAALQRKGIARDVIDATLAEISPDQAAKRLLPLLQRKVRTVKHTSQYDLKTKLIRYGLSLGYDYRTIMESVSQLVKTTDEECNDFHEF